MTAYDQLLSAEAALLAQVKAATNLLRSVGDSLPAALAELDQAAQRAASVLADAKQMMLDRLAEVSRFCSSLAGQCEYEMTPSPEPNWQPEPTPPSAPTVAAAPPPADERRQDDEALVQAAANGPVVNGRIPTISAIAPLPTVEDWIAGDDVRPTPAEEVPAPARAADSPSPRRARKPRG